LLGGLDQLCVGTCPVLMVSVSISKTMKKVQLRRKSSWRLTRISTEKPLVFCWVSSAHESGSILRGHPAASSRQFATRPGGIRLPSGESQLLDIECMNFQPHAPSELVSNFAIRSFL